MPTPTGKTKPKSIHDLSPKGGRDFDKADRNKMKIFGDTPDPRLKGRVYTPGMAEAAKRLRKKKGSGV